MDHFLDTSVARPVILGSSRYKRYFKEHFGNERLCVSEYVQMEFMRSWVSIILDFYFLLDMPGVETIGDAFNIWSNNFKSSRQKAVNQLTAQIFDTHAFELTDPGNKEKALRTIGRVVDRILLKWRDKFGIIGENIIQCQRAKVVLEPDPRLSDKERFRRFQTRFNDVRQCRGKCHVDKFFLEHHKSEVNDYLQHISGFPGQLKKKVRALSALQKS